MVISFSLFCITMSTLKTFLTYESKKWFFPAEWFCFSHPFAFVPPCSAAVIFWTVQYLVLYHPTHVKFPTAHTWNSNRYLFISYQLVCTSYAIGTFVQFSEDWSFLLATYFRLVLPTYLPTPILVQRACMHTPNNSPATNQVLHSCQITVCHSSSTWPLSLHIAWKLP